MNSPKTDSSVTFHRYNRIIRRTNETIHSVKRISISIALALAATLLSSAALGLSDPQDSGQNREIGRTTEKEIKVTLSSAFGTVVIRKGEPSKVLLAESADDRSASGVMDMEYAIRNRVGFLDVTLGEDKVEKDGKHTSFKLDKFDRGKWFLKFSEAIPISFDVELGVGKGDFNLTGLDVKDFTLSTGASDVSLAFDDMNHGQIENLTIESGVSKFDARNLANANFRHFRFQGGMGSYTLDFGGTLRNEVDVDIEVGLGLVTILIPEETGAKVIYEKSWASKLDCDDDFERTGDNEYISANYHRAAGRMNINIDSGFGSIKIRRR
ncbi:MAG: hypothetical protein H6Q31_601 [Bacteroidetes bacterium]|nr:hypothetical protein [Bacteroidota bacterium]